MTEKVMMRGAKFNKSGVGPDRCPIVQIPKPEIKKPDEVLIKVETVGICGTDIRGLADPPLFDYADGILVGHEACGIVEAVGSEVTACKVGDKVVVHPNIWCGVCEPCRTGHFNRCENVRHIGDGFDGAMADYMTIEERMVYVIDSKVPSDVAALAEPLACALNGTTSTPAHPGEEVVVLGGGPIGLIFAMIYKAMGAHVTVSEPGEYRRNMAKAVGIDVVVNPLEEDLDAVLRTYAPKGADVIVDAVGVMLPTAIKIARMGARIVIFGHQGDRKVEFSQLELLCKEPTIRGAYITKGTFPLAVKLLESGAIPFEKLITHKFPLEELLDGIALCKSANAGKVIIEI